MKYNKNAFGSGHGGGRSSVDIYIGSIGYFKLIGWPQKCHANKRHFQCLGVCVFVCVPCLRAHHFHSIANGPTKMSSNKKLSTSGFWLTEAMGNHNKQFSRRQKKNNRIAYSCTENGL